MGLFDDEATDDAGGKWRTEDDGASSRPAEALSDYVRVASRSNARFSATLILAGYSLGVPSASTTSNEYASSSAANDDADADDPSERIHQSWLRVDAHADALLRSNDPG